MNMELLSFSKEELNQIESLLQSSTKISKIYDKLCELEIKNLKETEEYKQLIVELKKEIEQENKKYKRFNLTYKQCLKYAKLLSSQAKINPFDTKIFTTLKNYNIRIIRRILLTLNIIVENNQDYQKSVIPTELLNSVLNITKENSKDDFIRHLFNSRKINNTLNNDINSIFLSILEEAISANSNKKYRNELIKAKYCIAFAHKNLETLLLPSFFEMTEIVYINSQIVTELLKEGTLSYDITRFVNLKAKASIEIEKLLEIKDQDYIDFKVNINSILTQCYIRALLSLMTAKEINDFNQEFHNIIENPKYLNTHLNDRISENAIIYCFKCFNRDKERTRILSIKTNI